jgi:hypothetical protein
MFHDQIITFEKVTGMRGMDPDGNIEAFCFLMIWYLVSQVGKYGLNVNRQTS